MSARAIRGLNQAYSRMCSQLSRLQQSRPVLLDDNERKLAPGVKDSTHLVWWLSIRRSGTRGRRDSISPRHRWGGMHWRISSLSAGRRLKCCQNVGREPGVARRWSALNGWLRRVLGMYSRVRGRRLLIILRSRSRWLGCRSRRRLWGPTSAPGLFESCEELLYFTCLLESIVNRLFHHCSVKMQ